MRSLRNTYVAMRHGESVPNEMGIIVSDPRDGVYGYCLTPVGKEEARHSAMRAQAKGLLDQSTVIVSSDFVRARETAEIAATVLGAGEIRTDPRLRERYFGQWDKTSNTNYEKIWSEDEKDHTHTMQGVESVDHVRTRALELIDELETKYEGKKILLVSHGDTLQILQTAFEDEHPSKHRSLEHLHTAEIRTMN